jgi:hypothetical protein
MKRGARGEEGETYSWDSGLTDRGKRNWYRWGWLRAGGGGLWVQEHSLGQSACTSSRAARVGAGEVTGTEPRNLLTQAACACSTSLKCGVLCFVAWTRSVFTVLLVGTVAANSKRSVGSEGPHW